MHKFPTVTKNLEKYIDAGYPILYVYTYEEAKLDRIISDIKSENIYEWNGAKGLVDLKTKDPQPFKGSLDEVLTYFADHESEIEGHWLVIKDAADLLNTEKANNEAESSKVIALLKELSRRIRNGLNAAIIIVAPVLHIPKALEKEISILELGYPDEKEINCIVKSFCASNTNEKLLDELTVALKGLTEFEINNLLKLAIASDDSHKFTKRALQQILDQKKQLIMKSGILEMIQLKEDIDIIGGLENLKEWLKDKAKVFGEMKKAQEFGVAIPKGVMIAGMPGCGKSLCAKAAGNLFNVPLLRLDMGRLMGKYVGESEENMRNAIRLTEAISPCVLWVDELEKAFAGIGGSSGSEVTTRLFGAFLTWMQEKTEPVFVIATANKIAEKGQQILPPELLRKGRFDEIYYVALPKPEERKKIFEIHIIKRRKQDVQNIDINALVEKTDGYTGADIENVVNESVEKAYLRNEKPLETRDILECIKNTHSLSEIMKEELEELDKIYKERKFKKASK